MGRGRESNCARLHVHIRGHDPRTHHASASIFVYKDRAEPSPSDVNDELMCAIVTGWAVHFMNFLSSPSVKLVRQEHSEALQKKRKKSGKKPLPGWYEITYRKVIQDYTKDKIATGIHHSFRYDVRGHFKTFTKGRMAGRVVWCPPHQRGLKHELYKPKIYKLDHA
jgi:hypothetical protein